MTEFEGEVPSQAKIVRLGDYIDPDPDVPHDALSIQQLREIRDRLVGDPINARREQLAERLAYLEVLPPVIGEHLAGQHQTKPQITEKRHLRICR
jgi:hypothetical protein